MKRSASGVYESELLGRFPWLIHGFGTRISAAWPGEYTSVKQVHSDRVVTANHRTGCLEEGDALISSIPGQILGIRTADCVPILFVDPVLRTIAAVHAGWRGTDAEIARLCVEKLQAEFGSKPQNIHAAIGPSIGNCCFEVGVEVAERFYRYFPDHFPDRARLTHIDLVEVNRRQLEAAGLDNNHIDVAGLCTVCDPVVFHSFRRDREQSGRMVSAIKMKSADSERAQTR